MTITQQQAFVEFALQHDVLRFGEFTLKSGRTSPYFFNAGLFNSGAKLAQLSTFYATTITANQLAFDVLFGPAYKGIPLVASTAIALANLTERDYPYCFNRKEAKDHGEGGNLVGAPLQGRVLLIDDVISAGTAIREAVDIIHQANAQLVGVVIALDRQERGQGQQSALQEIEQHYQIPVISIAKLNDLIDYVAQTPALKKYLAAIESYRQEYGV